MDKFGRTNAKYNINAMGNICFTINIVHLIQVSRMKCQYCNKREWQIIIKAEGKILGKVHKYLCCMQCFNKRIKLNEGL